MRRLSPLGTRLVLAFSLVSLVSVTLLAGAAQLAVDRGFRALRSGLHAGGRAGEAAQAEAAGRSLAWSWILVAALLALGLAVLAGWLVTRWLTRPLADLAQVARTFARGDRSARASGGAGELGDLARGFNEAADAVERSAAARRQMAADVAHELRTPLGALQAGLEELRDGLVPADPQTLARLHDQSVRLGRVVADLGVLAQAQDPGPDVVPGRTDLAGVVRDELAARGAELRAAGVTIGEVSLAPVPVHADRDRLHQVVGNLLANVARHCRPGDHVDVRVSSDGEAGILVVADTGPGIDPADLDRVFDRYWRGAAARIPGSGLGLAVVREIVEAHGGTVRLTSAGGTTATVRLRLA